jgi:hypothetical protein
MRDLARADHLVLVLHANSPEAQQFAVDGDVDVIAHGMWNWGSLNPEPRLPSEIALLLDVIAARRIGYQPTMRVIQGFRAYFDPGYLRSPVLSKVVPPDMLAWFKSDSGKWFKQELAAGATDEFMGRAYDQGPLRRGRQVVAYLASKNARFLFGTDTPAAPSYGNLPGLNQYLEMRELSDAGLSLEQILKAATLDNATAFGLDSDVGTIEPGKLANLVLLRRSPMQSVDAYDTVIGVWIHGRYAERGSLSADAR